jgi:hypothetical protein
MANGLDDHRAAVGVDLGKMLIDQGFDLGDAQGRSDS